MLNKNRFLYLSIVVFSIFSFNVHATFYEEESGLTYYQIAIENPVFEEWMGKYSSTKQMIDKRFPGLPFNLRNNLLSLKLESNYLPAPGDIGRHVFTTQDEVVLYVDGSLAIIKKWEGPHRALRQVSKREYHEFTNKLETMEFSGFNVGITSTSEAIETVESSAAEFKEVSYSEKSGISSLHVHEYKHFPTLEGVHPVSATLWFMQDKLYDIELQYSDKDNLDIVDAAVKILKKTFGRNGIVTKNVDAGMNIKYWSGRLFEGEIKAFGKNNELRIHISLFYTKKLANDVIKIWSEKGVRSSFGGTNYKPVLF